MQINKVKEVNKCFPLQQLLGEDVTTLRCKYVAYLVFS